MIQLERVRKLLARVTYKPGWRFCVAPHSYLGITLVVDYTTNDINNPTAPITVGTARLFDEMQLENMKDEDIVVHCIGGTIRDLEDHEFREHFRIDGHCVLDPHPEGK